MGAEVEYYRVNTQDDIAAYESETQGYNMLNVTLSMSLFDDERYQVYLRGSNLLNEKIWNHSSFLARVVPQPGRNLSAGLKYTF